VFLGAITGVPTPACLFVASNPVEAVTPPFGAGLTMPCGGQKDLSQVYLRTALGILRALMVLLTVGAFRRFRPLPD
jgi:hypothetical protein